MPSPPSDDCRSGRLILDVPRSAAWNMAIDEALLASSDADLPLLRRTAWSEPAATLGRFQTYREFEIAGARRPSVRRITGGGAILHHEELTIALVAETPTPAFPDPAPLELANRTADLLLTALGADALSRRGGAADERNQVDTPDCFERSSPFDLIDAAGRKVAGFALHRRGSRVLVQGSVRRALARLSEDDDARVCRAIGAGLGIELRDSSVDAATLERARELVDRRYGSEAWNRRR